MFSIVVILVSEPLRRFPSPWLSSFSHLDDQSFLFSSLAIKPLQFSLEYFFPLRDFKIYSTFKSAVNKLNPTLASSRTFSLQYISWLWSTQLCAIKMAVTDNRRAPIYNSFPNRQWYSPHTLWVLLHIPNTQHTIFPRMPVTIGRYVLNAPNGYFGIRAYPHALDWISVNSMESDRH